MVLNIYLGILMINIKNAKVILESFTTDYSLKINTGEWIAIVGKSGSGKSTLVNIIAGFSKLDSGSIKIDKEEISNLAPGNRPISTLFQENNLFSHLTVFENVAIAINPSLKLKEHEIKYVEESLANLEILDKSKSNINILSGGERQRVALARCISSEKKILLLDEPFSQLDPSMRIEMLNIIKKIKHLKKLTVIMVMHTPIEAKDFVDRFLVIKEGAIDSYVNPEDFTIDLY
tara:strand:- start:1641 stop:2339 length:699 start_codon:yes stop_codon:yes gene_type:complete